jgi:SNF2 family DNA or RNA helicase
MLSLRPYQESAADFLYEHDRAMVLAPVGAGKTALTLTAMQDALRDGVVTRWLVVAPLRVAQHVWPVEAPKWAPGLELAIAVGSPAWRLKALASNARVVVTNYDNLQWLAKQKLDFDGVVFDELTRLKNPSGVRFKALLKALGSVKVRWGLTGSFTSNGLEDVFGQCKIIDQSLLGRSKGAFLQQYFICLNREYGEWVPATGALSQVMARIKPATFVLEPGEYSDKLPPLHTVELRCELVDREPYEKMKKDFLVEFPDATAIAANAAAVTSKLQQMASGFVYETTRTASERPGKFDVCQKTVWFSDHKLELLEDLLDENQHANTIIVYNYQAELEALKRWHPQARTIDEPGVIDAWNRGEVELLLIHPKSAGHGLNLQHGGCRMVFMSLPWSLEEYEQTIGRLHRSGQRHDVWVYVLQTDKTIDEKIWAALHDKRALSDVAMWELK